MATGLGLRFIPSASAADVAAAVPIENEVMVTTDEGRIHVSQTGIADADAPLRALPFKNEVMLIGSGSSQGLTESFLSIIDDSHKHAVVLAKSAPEAIVSDLADKGTVSLINTETQAVLGVLAPISHVTGDKFGLLLSASDDLGIVAVANDVRAISIFIRSGNTYTEALAYTEASVSITSVSVSGDGSTIAVGYSKKSNLTGMVQVYRVATGDVTLYQTLSSSAAALGELFGSAVSLRSDGKVMAVGAEGDADGKGAAITFADNTAEFIETQKISVSNAVIGDKFGTALVLSGDGSMLAIGASGRTFTGSGVYFGSGAAFIANKMQSGLFSIDQELQDSRVGSDAGLGGVIALSGDKSTLLVGAKNSSFSGSLAGVVIPFVADSNVFSSAGLIEIYGANTNASFGQSISLCQKGRKAAIGSKQGILIAQSVSQWNKSIPEMTMEDVSGGSNKQCSVSGRVIKAAVEAEVASNPSGGQTTEQQVAAYDEHFGSDVWRRSPDMPDLNPQNYNDIIEGDITSIWLGPRTDNFGTNIVYEVSGPYPADFSVVRNTIEFSSDTLGVQVLDVTATGSLGGISTTVVNITVNFRVNTAPQFADKNITILTGKELVINLGPEVDIDGDTVTYTVTSVEDFTQVDRQLTYTTLALGPFTFTVDIIDSALLTSSYTINVTVIDELPDGVSNFVTGEAYIAEDYGTGVPDKYVPFIEPNTGCRVTRVTNAATDMRQSSNAVNGYSRYTQQNSDGSLYLAQGTNSTSCAIFNRYSGEVVAHLALDDSGLDARTIGMAHEIRWDKSGNHPNRIYFKMNAQFYMIDDVTQNNITDRSNPTRALIKDFDTEINWPPSKGDSNGVIYNDQEGDSSDDSDHWAWMCAYYDGFNYVIAAFIHYQISTDTTHILYPADLAGTNMDAFKSDNVFPKKPNMVEISPLGTGMVIHTGRSWGTMNTIGTWFDGPHLWPLDFDVSVTPPLKIGISESHSGWAYGDDGREMFVFQDDRRDVMSAVYITGDNKGYGLGYDAVPDDDAGLGAIDFYKHENLSWTGVHFGRMPASKKGWALMSTYGEGGWADSQLLMIRLKPHTDGALAWRVCPLFNVYQDNYWDEAPASISLDGNSIYVSNNWGAPSGIIETYRYDLPKNWVEHFDEIYTQYAPSIIITSVGVS